MKNCCMYLHVGVHKTGTTFLQQEIFPHWKGLVYIGMPYGKSLWERFLFSRGGGASAVLASSEHYSCPPLGKYLIDREQQTIKTSLSQVRDVTLRRLHSLFPMANIIVGFRPPVEWVESVYSNYLLHGGTVCPENFYGFDDHDAVITNADLKFSQTLSLICHLWPRVFPFLLSELTLLSGFLRELGDFCGVPPPEKLSANPVPRNTRLSRSRALEALNLNRTEGSRLPFPELRRKLISFRDAPEDGSGPVHLPDLSCRMIENNARCDWSACIELIKDMRSGDGAKLSNTDTSGDIQSE